MKELFKISRWRQQSLKQARGPVCPHTAPTMMMVLPHLLPLEDAWDLTVGSAHPSGCLMASFATRGTAYLPPRLLSIWTLCLDLPCPPSVPTSQNLSWQPGPLPKIVLQRGGSAGDPELPLLTPPPAPPLNTQALAPPHSPLLLLSLVISSRIPSMHKNDASIWPCVQNPWASSSKHH